MYHTNAVEPEWWEKVNEMGGTARAFGLHIQKVCLMPGASQVHQKPQAQVYQVKDVEEYW